MLKPERVTFSADDDKFHQFANSDQLNSFLNDSLVHYSTDFKKPDPQKLTPIKHSNSLDELSSLTMSSQQQQQQTEHEPPTSAPPTLIAAEIPVLNDTNLHQFDALTLQQLAIGSNQNESHINDEDLKTSPSHSTSLADIQKEVDRVRQMKTNRTYSSPTSSLCSRLTTNPFSSSNNNIDVSSITHSVHFNEQSHPTNYLPFSSTYITSIPESIVPPSGSSSTNENHFIPINTIESPTLEDREVFETFHTKQSSMPGIAIRQSVNSLNRNITSSETDFITSLHRSASKQALDNQSEHGTTYSGTSDDMIFVEWDKERNLFQDYINSLRTEIRVLLQERSEYQKQIETINNNLGEHKRINLTQNNTDQTKLDLLQKSLEEKNLVLEHLQKEYEVMKEKNSNLTRKISVLRCDGKAHTGVIDELKQKIAELTVDIQNHILVKRRLEISMINLESDCKLIDAERIRLNHDIKNTQLTKEELEKLLQQSNVQIAEQGSTIEMLRSDNIQVQSQLSATQRRMLQEKQQVMDYLRQIEDDLVEKEQVKQREALLRKDFEKLQLLHQQDRQEIDQLNSKIHQDKYKLDQLEQERLQLLKTIQNIDDSKIQLESDLDTYKSATKRLYTHFKIPFDSLQSIDQIIPMLEDRYRTEQISHARVHHIPTVQSVSEGNNEQETEEIRQLREELVSMNIKLKQLDEANQAWEQYQQNQLQLLHDRLKLNDIDNSSFEDIVQQIEHRFNDLNNQLDELNTIRQTNADMDELKQTTDKLQFVNTQFLPNDVRQSKDTQTQTIEDDQYFLQNKSLEVSMPNITPDTNKYEEEFQRLQNNLTILTAQCAQLDEANRAWQQFHQTQLDSFKEKLQDSLPLDNSVSFDEIAQHLIAHLDQQKIEHETLVQQLQVAEKLSNNLRSESIDDHQTIKQTYVNTINELNQQLNILKQHNDQLETEKYILNQQLENQASIRVKQERNTPTPDSSSSDSKLVKKHTRAASIDEVQIHAVNPVQSASPTAQQYDQEIQQLRDNLTLLTSQCAQLDDANRAWQTYQQTQLDTFRNTLLQYLPIDETTTLDQLAQPIIYYINKQAQDFHQKYQVLQKINEDLRSESAENLETIRQSYLNTVNELNQELLVLQEKAQLNNDEVSSDLLQESQVDALRNQLQSCLSIDFDTSLAEIAQQIADQVTKEREDFTQNYQAIEKVNEQLRSESTESLESIRESYMNTVNELNQELSAMKEAYELVDGEKQFLASELNRTTAEFEREQVKPSFERVPSDTFRQPFAEVPVHRSGVDDEQERDEVRQLRENMALLTAQCAQLDEANRAWQLFHQSQSNSLRMKLQDHLSVDENSSLEAIAQQIVDHLKKDKETMSEGERDGEEVRSEHARSLESIRASYVNTVNELNEELLAMKEAYERVNDEKEVLASELEKRSVMMDVSEDKPRIERVSSETSRQLLGEVPIHTSGVIGEQDAEELRQLREKVMALSAQCAQLDEANRAWQLYHQTELGKFKEMIVDYLPIDETSSLNEAAQQIINGIVKEREDFSEKYTKLEKTNDDLRSESANNLETIKQSYVNTIDELNRELLIVTEECEQLKVTKQVLNDQLEKQLVDNDRDKDQYKLDSGTTSLSHEVPADTSSLISEQDTEEIRQLRENLALLTAQYAQLDEANRAWQEFYQTQLNDFRTKIQVSFPADANLSLDQIAQQLVDQISKEREDFTVQYQALENANNDLQSASIQENKELLAMKEQYQQVLQEKENLLNQIENQPVINNQAQDIQTLDSKLLQQQAEMSVLQETLASLTSQLDETVRSRQDFEQTQIDSLKTLFPFSNETSLNEIIQETVLRTVDLTKEVGSLREKERESIENFEHIKNRYEQLLEENRLTNTGENQKNGNTMDADFVALQNQCAQLDTANRAWQLFYSEQIDSVKKKLNDYINFDDNLTFDQIIQLIVGQFEHQNRFNESVQLDAAGDNLNLLKKQLADSQENEQILNQQIFTLQSEYQTLEQQLNAQQLSIDSLKNNLQFLSNENEQVKQLHDELQQKHDLLVNNNQQLTSQLKDVERQTARYTPISEAPIHTIASVQSASSSHIEEELQQLRANLTTLTAQCSQLDEANRAWQQYHQNQLELFRNKLQDWIPLDDSATLEQLAQEIISHLDELGRNSQLDASSTIDSMQKQLANYHSNESLLAQNLEQLNQKLMNVYKECEEFREHNAELISSKERTEKQLEEQEQRINDLQLSDYNSGQLFHFRQQNESLTMENQQLQMKINDLEQRVNQVSTSSIFQRVDSPRENVAIHNVDHDRDEEIRQLRTALAAASAHCSTLDEANRAWQTYQYEQIESFRQKLQDRLPSLSQAENSSLAFIAQQVVSYLDALDAQRESLMRHNDLLKDEMQLQKQQSGRPGSANSDKRMVTRRSHDRTIPAAQIHAVNPVQSASPTAQQYDQEIQQLRDNLTLLTSQCAQLDEANRAWQTYQQTQLDTFRNTLLQYLPIDETITLDQLAQPIIYYINKQAQDFDQKYQALQKINEDLRSESAKNLETIRQSYLNTVNELNQELLVLQEKAQLNNGESTSDLLRQSTAEMSTRSDGESVFEAEAELRQHQQSQVDALRNQLQSCLSIDFDTSLAEIAQQIADQVTKEREDFTQNYQAIEKVNEQLRSESTESLESIRESYINTVNELNQELSAMKEAYELVDGEKQFLASELNRTTAEFEREQAKPSIERVPSDTFRQPFAEVPVHRSGVDDEQEKDEVRQLRENIALLTAQCAQLDEANRAWQLFHQSQSNSLRMKLQDHLSVDENSSLEAIAQQIVDHLKKDKETMSEGERDGEEVRSEHARSLESIRASYVNTVNELNEELLAMKEAYERVNDEKEVLASELEKRSVMMDVSEDKPRIERVSSGTFRQPLAEVGIHKSSADVEEDADKFEQLRENVVALSTQCAQLEEANRAWQLYQQTQFDNFRNTICDILPFDENASFDEIARQIADQIIKEREDFKEKYAELEKTMEEHRSEPTSIETTAGIDQELFHLKKQYEELEKLNKQLLIDNEYLNNQLNERSIVVGHHSTSPESNIIENETELSSPSVPIETEEIHQLRTDLASITSQLAQLSEANQNELDTFANKLQNWISLSPSSTLDEIARQLSNHFVQQQQNIPQTTETETQTNTPIEKAHIATETNRLTYENHHTQIDPIDMIDQQIQTDSFLQLWSTSDDENLFPSDEEDDRLREYIDEISSLSSTDLSTRLDKECHQILSKQNLQLSSYPNLDSNHRALLTVYLLYNQHLTDDAKQLYNETLIRALKQEYEMINNEKNEAIEGYNSLEEKCLNETSRNENQFERLQNKYDELLEQNELERLDSKQSSNDLIEKYNLREKQFEFNLYNLHQENEKLKYEFNNLENKYRTLSEKDHEQLERDYQQLREDFNDLINENELLKDYNSQMYQRKLKGNQDSEEIETTHDIDIQCNLSEELQLTKPEESSWNNDWNEDNTVQEHLPIQEQASNETEINRLKALITEIQLENDNLKDLNSQLYQASLQSADPDAIIQQTVSKSHDVEIQCVLLPVSDDNYIPAVIEQRATVQTEDNDWNDQMSPIEIPTEEFNFHSTTAESLVKQTMDNETQTDEQPQDKHAQISNKLKRALQTIKDRINQVVTDQPELFVDTGDDTIERLDHLISTVTNQVSQIDILQNEREDMVNKLRSSEAEPIVSTSIPSERETDIHDYEDQIRLLTDERNNLRQRNEQLEKNIYERQSNIEITSFDPQISNDNSTQTDVDQERRKTDNMKSDENDESTLTNRLFGFISNVTSSPTRNETVDNETQTDEQPQDKHAQINNKLKRALQTIKDRINQAVSDQPQLFVDTSDDTIERLDHLISSVANQAAYIDNLQNERDHAQHEINQLQSSLETYQYQIDNERPIKTDQLVSTSAPSDDMSSVVREDYQKQIHELQGKLAANNDERTLLRERLNDVELELRKALDDRAAIITMNEEQLEALVQERDALVEQQIIQSTESQRILEQLQQQLDQLAQSSATSHVVDSTSIEDIKSLQEVIQQQSEELRDLSDKYFTLSSHVTAQDEVDRQKKETEERLTDYQNQIQNLLNERVHLLDEVQKNTALSSIQTTDTEKSTTDQQHDKLVKVNNKLKRALQTFKDKIHRVVSDRPDLFVNVGEETSERLDHLISTIEHQATQLDLVQSERDESEGQLRNEIRELQSSLDANLSQINTEQVPSIVPTTGLSSDVSSSMKEDYERQLHQLKQKLSANDDERTLLRERLNEVELELRNAFDDRTAVITMNEEQLEALIQERDTLVEQQVRQSAETQHEIEQLQQEISALKQSSVSETVDTSSNEEIESLKDINEQQVEELRALSEKYMALVSESSSTANLRLEFDEERKETQERLTGYENQIQNLLDERTRLLDEVQKNTALSSVQTTDTEKSTIDQQHDKLVKVNNKLKRALQTFKDKIHRVVSDRPDLFVNVGEETSERLDHLLSTIEHQATQLDLIQSERDESEEQLRNEIQELQSSMETYRYQIENERPVRTEQLVATAPSSDDRSRLMIDEYQKQINQLQQKLSANDDERSLLRERLNEVELEFRKSLDDRTSTIDTYEEKLRSLVEQQTVQSVENQSMIEQLEKELRHLNEKYTATSSQLESQAELDRQKRETEERLTDYENQIQNLLDERTRLLDEIQKNNALSSIQTTDTEKSTTDQQHDKLVKVNNKLKRALQTFKDKIHRVVSDRPDLFVSVGEETSERLDHLLSTIEHQATQLDLIQSERDESEGQLRNEIRELQNSFDLYRQQIDSEHPSVMTHKIDTEIVEHRREIQPKQTSNDNQWNDWSTDPVHTVEEEIQHRKPSDSSDHQEPTVANRLFGFLKNVTSSFSEEPLTNDWNDQHSPLQFPTEEATVEHSLASPSSANNSIQSITSKVHQIVLEYPNLFPHSTGNTLEDLNQLNSILRNLQDQINKLQSLPNVEEHRKQINELNEKLHETELVYQREIERLVEERDQAKEQHSSKLWNDTPSKTSVDDTRSMESRLSDYQTQIDVLLRERVSLMEQIKELTHQSVRNHTEIQSQNDNEPSTPSEQRIPRRVFEQEMLAWSKESEQLKQFVRQIQVENKKLKDIILKFERITHEYTQENERLKRENQHLSFLSYSTMQTIDETEDIISSDADICYLTLKWLTYEVAERTSDNHGQSSFTIDNNDPYLRQRLDDTERQLKSIRIQNQRLKKQLETYTIQFKHIQHDMNVKNQELSTIKNEVDRLRTSETQYRLEVDRLKADIQCDQVKIQHLERELSDLKLGQGNTDNSPINNLRELLELKERELNALKEKLDYMTQSHQLELQEAIKANQFSLDNVQRFEQLDQRHSDKRKDLEVRLKKFCTLVKPIVDDRQSFNEDSRIDIDELQQLITDTEAEERVTNSLGPIRDCLGLLENQMKDLHHNLIETHARREKSWKYKVGFEHTSCERQWEVTHDVETLQVEPNNGSERPLVTDFVESDIRLSLDDRTDDVNVRTTVK